MLEQGLSILLVVYGEDYDEICEAKIVSCIILIFSAKNIAVFDSFIHEILTSQ